MSKRGEVMGWTKEEVQTFYNKFAVKYDAGEWKLNRDLV